MNYTIAGQDRKLYGPATADQVRQWITQCRVDSRTPVFPEGATEWTYAGLVPELAPHFGVTPPLMKPLPAGPGMMPVTNKYATWGLVCGVLAWTFCCCCCLGLPLSVLGLIFSIIGLSEIRANPQTQQGRGMAIAGIVLCGLNLAWSIVGSALDLALGAQPDLLNNLGQNLN